MMLMCVCESHFKNKQIILRQQQHIYWIHSLSSQFECSVNIITHFISSLNISLMLIQMFNEQMKVSYDVQWTLNSTYTTNYKKIWAQSASSQTVVLKVNFKQDFSALSHNVITYVWKWSFNLSMKSTELTDRKLNIVLVCDWNVMQFLLLTKTVFDNILKMICAQSLVLNDFKDVS
jgi:hypothetical protein